MNIKKMMGKRIQELRKSQGLTQEKLAEMIDIEPASLSNIENGKYYPTAENLNKILDGLKTTPNELFAFSHLAEQTELIAEMNKQMIADEKLTRLMYKFFLTVKNS